MCEISGLCARVKDGETATDAVEAMRAQEHRRGVGCGGVAGERGWARVGGLDEAKACLEEAVMWVYDKQGLFERLGVRPPRGILLYGPPGTGKTLLARAAAEASHAHFVSTSAVDLVRAQLGESERLLRALFRRARDHAPTVLFFDEIQVRPLSLSILGVLTLFSFPSSLLFVFLLTNWFVFPPFSPVSLFPLFHSLYVFSSATHQNFNLGTVWETRGRHRKQCGAQVDFAADVGA